MKVASPVLRGRGRSNASPLPGDRGPWSCDRMLPAILPRGYTLTVHGAGGFHKTYRGKASP
ncbi:DddA-like double-stranded DNA deaminase toxin [Actinokineospora terrae]|uniref:DddA-like double-stranded DNA deaminase toxin n=1 Tax=Actinokineospora terrae TaxID=155974 RepID=UPI003CCBD998